MGTLFDQQLKQKYALIYFKRNFWNKIQEAHRWSLDDRDIMELKAIWKRKAETLGSEGLSRWEEIETEWESRTKQYVKMRGIAWQLGDKPEWMRRQRI